MPIDETLERIDGNVAEDTFLMTALARIEGFRGLPLEFSEKERLLRDALSFIKKFKIEAPQFYQFEYDPSENRFKLMNLAEKLQGRERQVRLGSKEIAESGVIFSYFIGAVEDRNRLLNNSFYPARGHDYFWGLVNEYSPEQPQEECERLIAEYNSRMGIPRNKFKPIRLPTDLLHGHFFSTTFQFFKD